MRKRTAFPYSLVPWFILLYSKVVVRYTSILTVWLTGTQMKSDGKGFTGKDTDKIFHLKESNFQWIIPSHMGPHTYWKCRYCKLPVHQLLDLISIVYSKVKQQERDVLFDHLGQFTYGGVIKVQRLLDRFCSRFYVSRMYFLTTCWS